MEALETLVDYYYPRATWLQDNCNLGNKSYTCEEANEIVNDDLMQNITIYDCYQRRAAGFSNVLNDLQVDSSIKWDLPTWLYTFLVHRITGSGASFQEDHGYRNNVVQYFSPCKTISDKQLMIIEYRDKKKPMFTSKGNQPPVPRKGVSNVDFMLNELPYLCDLLADFITQRKRKHKEVVDFLNDYNIKNGHRRFNFQYAALSMDISDYFPDLVDETSHTYLGSNAKKCIKLVIPDIKDEDKAMDVVVEKTGGLPKDLEDVLCDFVRFGQNYDPYKRGIYYNNTTFKPDWGNRSQ